LNVWPAKNVIVFEVAHFSMTAEAHIMEPMLRKMIPGHPAFKGCKMIDSISKQIVQNK